MPDTQSGHAPKLTGIIPDSLSGQVPDSVSAFIADLVSGIIPDWVSGSSRITQISSAPTILQIKVFPVWQGFAPQELVVSTQCRTGGIGVPTIRVAVHVEGCINHNGFFLDGANVSALRRLKAVREQRFVRSGYFQREVLADGFSKVLKG